MIELSRRQCCTIVARSFLSVWPRDAPSKYVRGCLLEGSDDEGSDADGAPEYSTTIKRSGRVILLALRRAVVNHYTSLPDPQQPEQGKETQNEAHCIDRFVNELLPFIEKSSLGDGVFPERIRLLRSAAPEHHRHRRGRCALEDTSSSLFPPTGCTDEHLCSLRWMELFQIASSDNVAAVTKI